MFGEILYLILLGLLIILTLFGLIAIWRFIDILDDVKSVTSIARKRTNQIDEYIESVLSSFKEMSDMIKGFLYSFDIIRTVRNKFFEDKNKTKAKGEDHE